MRSLFFKPLSVREEQAQGLMHGMRGLHAVAGLAVILIAALLWDMLPVRVVAVWAGGLMVVQVLAELVLHKALNRRSGRPAGAWLPHYTAVSIAASLFWGIGGLVFAAHLDHWQALLVVVILLVITAAIISPLSYLAPLYAVVTPLTTVPGCVFLVLQFDAPWLVACGLMGLVGTGAFVAAAYRGQEAHLQGLLARDSLDRVRQDLMKEQARLQAAQDRIRRGGLSDPLSGMHNLSGFMNELREHLASEKGAPLAVACVNLDGFRGVNAVYGMRAGDRLLRIVAERLATYVGGRERVARVAADEFLVLRPGHGSTEALEAFAQGLLTHCALPQEVHGARVQLSASAGLAACPAHGTDALVLVERAVLAMREAKSEVGASFRIYTQALGADAQGRVSMRMELAQALDRGEFQLAFQPQIDLVSRHVIGAEALLRWNSAKLGHVSPADFIPVAEDSGLIVPIGDWVMREAAAAAVRLQQWGRLQMAINASVRQFSSGRFVSEMRMALEKAGLDPHLFSVELTESVFMSDPDTVGRALADIRSLGVRVALDDFGTGFSSLGYLRQMDIDYLKLDRSFISEMTAGERQAAVVRAVLNLAKALETPVVAEGIERESELNWLRAEGCRYGQGYLFARPMSEADLVTWLETSSKELAGA